MVDARLGATSVWIEGGGSGPHSAAVIGDGATALGDESDATYAEVWTYTTDSATIPYNSEARADLEPLTGMTASNVTAVSLHLRFSTINELSASMGRVRAALHHPETGDYIVEFGRDETLADRTDSTGGAPVTVDSPLTAAEFDWAGADLSSVASALASGAQLRFGRYAPLGGGSYPASYGLRVYEAWLVVTGEASPEPELPAVPARRLTRVYPIHG